jgi:hypothetical protein
MLFVLRSCFGDLGIGSDGPDHLLGFLPKDGVDLLDVAECECRRKVLALELVLVAFS